MPDPFSGATGSTKQEINILGEVKERKRSKARSFGSENQTKEDKKSEKAPIRVSELYNAGIALLKARGYTVELTEGGDHVNHRVLKPTTPQTAKLKGIVCPHSFNPLQDISDDLDFSAIEDVFLDGSCSADVRQFWEPFFSPKAGDSPLQSWTERRLRMLKINSTKNIHQTLDYGHTFDPAGRWGGETVLSPRIWVPDRGWFDPILHRVNFADIFTIFPEAELEMLKLILG